MNRQQINLDDLCYALGLELYCLFEIFLYVSNQKLIFENYSVVYFSETDSVVREIS